MNTETQKFYIRQVEVGPMQNYMYIIGDREKKEAVIIDPAWEVDRVLTIAASDGLRITSALVTHTHFDHVNGAADFLNRINAPIFIHKNESTQLKDIRTHVKAVSDGDKILVGDISISFLHTPGHTPGSQCFLVSDHLVAGDTLFINACGRCDLPGGNPEEMYRSLTEKLMKLEDNVILLPGHNYADEPTSTIKNEKKNNPYLRCANLSEFLRVRTGL